MARLGLFFVVIAAFAVIFSGSAMAVDAAKPAAAPPPSAMPAPAPTQPAEPNFASMDPNTVMAKYGDQKLTLQDIKYIIPAVTPESARQLAQQWIELQMMYEAAKQRGLPDDPKLKLLSDLGAKSLYARELMNKVASEVNIPEATLREYYDKNKNTDPQLFEPNRFSFSHVKCKVLADANKVKTRIETGEEDISQAAKESSFASDAMNGGAVKKIPQPVLEQQYGKEFVSALSRASEGQLIGPIKTKDGYYEIARHEGKLAGKVYPFEMVKDTIKRREEQMAKGETQNKFIENLKKNSQSKSYLSPLLEIPKPKVEEGKSAKEPNLPIDKTKTEQDNAVQKK